MCNLFFLSVSWVVFLHSFLLQYFVTVGWFFWPVKTVSHITYTVLAGTLNTAQSIQSNVHVMWLAGDVGSRWVVHSEGESRRSWWRRWYSTNQQLSSTRCRDDGSYGVDGRSSGTKVVTEGCVTLRYAFILMTEVVSTCDACWHYWQMSMLTTFDWKLIPFVTIVCFALSLLSCNVVKVSSIFSGHYFVSVSSSWSNAFSLFTF